MSIILVEAYFKKTGAIVERRNEALFLKAQEGIGYPIIFTEDRHGWTEARLVFHGGEEKKVIEQVDGFCIEVEKYLGPGTPFVFDPQQNFFSLKRTFLNDELAAEVDGLLRLSGYLLSLCLKVFEEGRWNKDLVYLVFSEVANEDVI